MTKIQLIGDNIGTIELNENIIIPLSFGVADIKEIDKRKSAFSKTITVPGTKNNHQIFNHYYNVNIDNGDFINNIVKCVLISDSGEILFNNGVIQLLRVVKNNNTAVEEDKVIYEILLKDETGDFITNMGNKKLEDLFLQDLNHRYDLATVSASWSHTQTNGYKYILPHIQPLGLATDNQFKLTEIKPAIYAKTYWDRIFLSNGYTYTWSDLSTTDFQFDKLLIPYNGDVPKLSQQDVEALRVIAELSTPTTYNVGTSFVDDTTVNFLTFPDGIGRDQFIMDTEIEDIASLYDPITGEYIPNYDAQTSGGIDFSFEIDYDVIIENPEVVNIQLKPKTLTSVPTGTDIINLDIISSVRNNTQSINYDYYINSFQLAKDFTLTPGDNTVFSATNTFTQVAPNINSFNELINNIAFKVSHIFEGDIPKQGKWYDPAGTGTNVAVNYKIQINAVRVKITPSVNNAASYGSIVNMNNMIPKNIKQTDFIKSICMMYNLFILPDPNNPSNLIIKQKDKYYDEGEIKDWTYLLAKDLDQSLEFLSDLTAKKLTLTYKQDNDIPNKGYFDNIGEIYGQAEYIFESEYVKNEEKKEIIFSPTPNGNTSFGANLPIINGTAPKTNIRILYDGGLLPCQEFIVFDTGAINTAYTTYPFVGHFDKPTDSTFDLNFATPDYLFYDDFNTITNRNLFNKFWLRTFKQINSSKVLTAYFNLDDKLIAELKLNDKIYLKQYESYFAINQIFDYIVGGKVLTKVELVQIQDNGVIPIIKEYAKPNQIEFPAASLRFTNLNYGPNRSDINIIGFDNYVTNNSTNIEIIGNSNNVGGSNINVYGNNNIDYWNNTTVNISNIIVTNPNTTNNISSDGLWLKNNPTNPTEFSIYSSGNNTNIIDDLSLYSFIGGGKNNLIDDSVRSSIIGGNINTISSNSDASSIIAGNNNTIDNDSNLSSIIGGGGNRIDNGSNLSSIIGGEQGIINTDSRRASIIGGIYNTIDNDSSESSIIGGAVNRIDNNSDSSSIIGGQFNTIDNVSNLSSIIGGRENNINGFSFSVILGGQNITAIADDTVYVPFLNIKDVPTGTPVKALGVESNGNVVEISGLPTTSTWAQVLVNGNSSGGTDVNITNGDKIIADDGGTIVIEASDSINGVSSIYTITPALTTHTVSEPGVGDFTTILQSTFKIAIGSMNSINNTVSNSNYVPNGFTHTTEDLTTNDSCTLGIGINDIELTAFNGVTNEISNIIQTPQSISQVVDLDGTNTEYAANFTNYDSINLTVSDGVDTSTSTMRSKYYRYETSNPTTTLTYSTNIGEDSTFGFDGINNLINTSLFPNPIAGHTVSTSEIESFIRINSSIKGTRIAQNNDTITLETNLSTGELGAITITPTLIRYNEYNEIKNKQNVVTTTGATVTNLTTYSPGLGIDSVFTVEFDVYGFEPATGDAIGAKALAVFKVVGGVVIQVAGTTLDRKSNFPGAVTAIVDTDGTIVRFRVQGQAGRTINWKGGYVINN